MVKSPYALPNLISALFLFLATLGISLFLEETGELCRDKFDLGLQVGRWIKRRVLRHRFTGGHSYTAIPSDESMVESATELQPTPTSMTQSSPYPNKVFSGRPKLPFRRIWTPNVSNVPKKSERLGCCKGFKTLATGLKE